MCFSHLDCRSSESKSCLRASFEIFFIKITMKIVEPGRANDRRTFFEIIIKHCPRGPTRRRSGARLPVLHGRLLQAGCALPAAAHGARRCARGRSARRSFVRGSRAARWTFVRWRTGEPPPTALSATSYWLQSFKDFKTEVLYQISGRYLNSCLDLFGQNIKMFVKWC